MIGLLLTLFYLLNVDAATDRYKGPQWSMLLFYMILNVYCADQIGGKFAYVYAILCASCRAYVGMLVWNGFLVELWSSANLIIGYVMVCYLIQSKNKVTNELRQSSLTDPLTKLPNRRAFKNTLDRAMSYVQRTNECMSVAYIDVDGFKAINDNRGHHVGDELLCNIGNTITHTLRGSDMGARLGGDEFAIIFMDKPDDCNDGAHTLTNRVKHNLDKMCDGKYDVSFSIGVVLYDGKFHATSDQLITFADHLMYEVKKSSKNDVKVSYFCLH